MRQAKGRFAQQSHYNEAITILVGPCYYTDRTLVTRMSKDRGLCGIGLAVLYVWFRSPRVGYGIY